MAKEKDIFATKVKPKEKTNPTPQDLQKKELTDYYYKVCENPNGINWEITNAQIKNLKNEGYTYSGLKYALWFAKEHQGLVIDNISIAKYCYKDAKDYYYWLKNMKKQLSQWKNNDKIVVAKTSTDIEQENIFV